MNADKKTQQNSVPLGVLSTGESVALDLGAPAHMAIQGMTRSGKTAGAYAFLASLASLAPRVRVHVIDPTTVLGRPLQDHPAGGRLALGTSDPHAPGEVVGALLEDMRERVAGLWDKKADKFTTWTKERPLEVLIVEELPGVVEWLEDDDKAEGRKPADRLAPRFIAGIRQLLAQGLKVGVVVVLLAQRFDAALITGAARSNIGVRVCLRVDDLDAVRMLFPGVESEDAQRLALSRPGRGLITTPHHRAELVALHHLNYAGYLHRLGAHDSTIQATS